MAEAKQIDFDDPQRELEVLRRRIANKAVELESVSIQNERLMSIVQEQKAEIDRLTAPPPKAPRKPKAN